MFFVLEKIISFLVIVVPVLISVAYLTLAERKYPSLAIEKLTLPSELRELAGTEVHRVTLRSDGEREYGVDQSVEDA